LDRGTQFKIYFPLISEEDKAQAGEKDRDLFLGNGQTILIVEDDDGIRYMLTEYLQELNYKIIIANNGIEALQILNEKKVDAVLTDLTMPDMGGMELFKNIKQRFSNIPIIAMSGYYDYKELQNFQFDDLLEKPLDMSKVSIIFNKLLKNL
jgi:CheY-like chemotaxis protein